MVTKSTERNSGQCPITELENLPSAAKFIPVDTVEYFDGYTDKMRQTLFKWLLEGKMKLRRALSAVAGIHNCTITSQFMGIYPSITSYSPICTQTINN